jgi:hypothetical protein
MKNEIVIGSEAPTPQHRYGDDKTIHRTDAVNVERDPNTGAVVAVWYRCAILPFTDKVCDENRADAMRSAYQDRESTHGIKAIVFHDQPRKKDGQGSR